MQNQPNREKGERSEGDDELRLISPEEAERNRVVDAAVEKLVVDFGDELKYLVDIDLRGLLNSLDSREQHDLALKLIEKGGSEGCRVVAENLHHFSDLDHREIALKIIERGSPYAVAQNLDRFSGLDRREIALGLDRTWRG